MPALEQVVRGSTVAAGASFWDVVRENVRTLHPAYFALVMATGIVSIAAHLTGMFFVGRMLAAINAVAYVTLIGMTLARVFFFPRAVFDDLIDHQRGVGFFTLVAATAVFGSQYVILFKMFRLGMEIGRASCRERV